MNRRGFFSDLSTMPKCLQASSAKAVADGAAAWYISSFVIARATRFRYGITVRVPHDTSDRRQIGRAVSHELDGEFVNGVWSEIVAKVGLFGNNLTSFAAE